MPAYSDSEEEDFVRSLSLFFPSSPWKLTPLFVAQLDHQNFDDNDSGSDAYGEEEAPAPKKKVCRTLTPLLPLLDGS